MAKEAAPKVWVATIIIAGIAAVWFLWPQLSVLVFSALMAFLFYPLFVRLRRRKGHMAAVTTLLASFLVVLIPLAVVVIATIGQLIVAAEELGRTNAWQHVPEFSGHFIGSVNSALAAITGSSSTLTEQGVVDFLRTAIPAAARALASIIVGFATSLPQLGIALIIYLFVFVELLLHGPKLIAKLYQLSPYGRAVTQRYIERIGLMANAMMKGQLVISMIISALSALLLIPLGFGDYFFILFILFTVLNMIPLGCGVVMFPVAIYCMFTGQFWPGLVVLLLYLLVSNFDSFLRPRFVPKTIQLSTALMTVATFCGIAYFGILGVVYGPIIMIVLITTADMYIEAKNK